MLVALDILLEISHNHIKNLLDPLPLPIPQSLTGSLSVCLFFFQHFSGDICATTIKKALVCFRSGISIPITLPSILSPRDNRLSQPFKERVFVFPSKISSVFLNPTFQYMQMPISPFYPLFLCFHNCLLDINLYSVLIHPKHMQIFLYSLTPFTEILSFRSTVSLWGYLFIPFGMFDVCCILTCLRVLSIFYT